MPITGEILKKLGFELSDDFEYIWSKTNEDETECLTIMKDVDGNFFYFNKYDKVIITETEQIKI